MTPIASVVRWLVSRPTGRPATARAVRHIEHDYGYHPRGVTRLPGVDAETRRQSMHLVGQR